ncbi:MAG: hypothetical protein ACD_14C00046G0004 [uncultured bacterium]|nr:MAG: hypothetical protein ACD_14C00046G0004 [uncultured bacterium]
MTYAAYMDLGYSCNSSNTRKTDIKKILRPVEMRMYQSKDTTDWNSFVVLAKFACFMSLMYFKNDPLGKVGEEIEVCVKSGKIERIEKFLASYQTSETSQDCGNSDEALAKKSLLYTATLPTLIKKPLYFFSREHIDKYIEVVSDIIALLERSAPNISWLDRLEKTIAIQLGE